MKYRMDSGAHFRSVPTNSKRSNHLSLGGQLGPWCAAGDDGVGVDWRRPSDAAARNGSGRTDPTPAAQPWVPTQGRAFLPEPVKISGFGYYKGGTA
jgi:hypothetical protein